MNSCVRWLIRAPGRPRSCRPGSAPLPAIVKEGNMRKSQPQPLTRMIARYIRNLTYREVPQSELDPLRQSILDCIGCGIKGSTTEFSMLVAGYVNKWGSNG